MRTTKGPQTEAFRRGVRDFKVNGSNPYNGPELRDEWQAGFESARLTKNGREVDYDDDGNVRSWTNPRPQT